LGDAPGGKNATQEWGEKVKKRRTTLTLEKEACGERTEKDKLLNR